jgi:intein-encoded DNA endonuclease-like protein
MANPIQLPHHVVEKIIYDYTVNRFGLIKTGKNNDVSHTLVRKILLENKIHIRSQSEAAVISNIKRRQFDINDDYFSNESANMAYLLGFLASDGTVDKKNNRIKIGLSSIDRDFLETIAQELGFEGKIFNYETNNGYQVSELTFTSPKIKQELSKYNIVPNKTFTFKFPNKLSKIYWIDFIRGYFDGDGSVSVTGAAIRWQVCSATKDILETIVNFFFEEYGINKVSILQQVRENKPLYYIQYSTNATKQIFKILYQQDSLKLPRKYNKFKELVMK